MDDVTVRRVDFGYFVRPPEEAGTEEPHVERWPEHPGRHEL